MNYNILKNHVIAKKCILLTKEYEYINMMKNDKIYINIISLCGHENIVRTNLFCYQDNGVYCKKCMPTIVSNNASKLKTLNIEYEGFLYIKSLLTPYVEISKMVEGTKADFAIKMINSEKLWMPIQLKVTAKPKQNRSNQYLFSIQHNYEMPILCICLSDKKMWLFPERLLGKKNLQIGYNKSKYQEYEINLNNINERLHKIYNISSKDSIENLNIPESRSQKQEQKFRKQREEYFSNTLFEYPEQNGLPYDFSVNGQKFQEKVLCKNPKTSGYICTFGKRKNKNTIIQYCKNDADYYWFHIPDTKIYYIIPENILIEKGYINDTADIKKGKTIAFYPNKQNDTNWQNSYKYFYKDEINILDLKTT